MVLGHAIKLVPSLEGRTRQNEHFPWWVGPRSCVVEAASCAARFAQRRPGADTLWPPRGVFAEFWRTPLRPSAGGAAFEPSTLTLAAGRAVISACSARFHGVLSCLCGAIAGSAVDFDVDRAGCACTRSLTQRQQQHGCRAWHGSVLRPISPRAGQECMACALGPLGPGKPSARLDVRSC